MAKRTSTTKRNPQDATLTNVRAARKRETTLETRVQALEKRVRAVERDIRELRAVAAVDDQDAEAEVAEAE